MSISNMLGAAGCVLIKGFSSESNIREREIFVKELGTLRHVVIKKEDGQLLDSVIVQYDRVLTARKLTGKSFTCDGSNISVEAARGFRDPPVNETSQADWARKVQDKVVKNRPATLGSPGEIFAKFNCEGDLQERVEFCENYGAVERIESHYRKEDLGPSIIVTYQNCNEALEMLQQDVIPCGSGSVSVSPNLRYIVTPKDIQQKRNAHWEAFRARRN